MTEIDELRRIAQINAEDALKLGLRNTELELEIERLKKGLLPVDHEEWRRKTYEELKATATQTVREELYEQFGQDLRNAQANLADKLASHCDYLEMRMNDAHGRRRHNHQKLVRVQASHRNLVRYVERLRRKIADLETAEFHARADYRAEATRCMLREQRIMELECELRAVKDEPLAGDRFGIRSTPSGVPMPPPRVRFRFEPTGE